MAQIKTKFIESNAVTDAKIRLTNNGQLRARNAANSADVNILKVNASDRIEFASVPQSPADATTANDLVRFSQLAALAEGMAPKAGVVVATTAAGTLATSFEAGDTIDGHVLVAGERILIKDQALPEENGIYVVQASGAPVRAADMSAVSEVPGAYTVVELGTQAGYVFITTSTPSTIDVDPILWVSRAIQTYTGGDMIALSSGVFSVDLAAVSGLESSNPGNAAGQLRVKLEASNPSLQIDGSNQLGAKLNAAGAIVTGASGLAAQVDASTIEINGSNQLAVKNLGVTAAKISSGAATAGQVLTADGAGNASFASPAAVPLAQDHILVGSAGGVATDVAMSGEASIVASGAITLSNSAVIGKVLTGYTAGAGTVSATDSILAAIQKLDGNDGNFANKALSNLASVAVNASLIAGADATLDLGSSALQWDNVYVKSKIESNAAAGGIGTGFIVQTKSVTGANSANMVVYSGSSDLVSGSASFRSSDVTAAGAASGTLSLRSGTLSGTGAGNSGSAILISGGISNAGASGATGTLSLNSGNNAGSGASGAVTLASGTVVAATSGAVTISSGAPSGAGTSGAVTISSGAPASGGTSGNITIATGSGAGVTRGNAALTANNVLIGSTTGTAVYLQKDTLPGNGTIGSPAGVDNSVSLGSSSFRFANIFAVKASAGTANVLTLEGSSIALSGAAGASIKITNVTDPTANQDAATKKYVDDQITGAAKITTEENITLTGTDITNQYVDLQQVVQGTSASVNSVSLNVVGGLEQLKTVDYAVLLTSGVGGKTRITFIGDLGTGGAAELVAGDILMIKYTY